MVNAPRSGGTLGTFAGVFTPSILTILGIILFLRLGYVVGSAGLIYALIIIAIANMISVLTSFSLAAIATNLKVKGGGDYYLISRTLGLEFGGALGLVLFLAQSVSIAFYCIGFGEVVSSLFPGTVAAHPQVIAGLAVSFLFVLAWVGADLATKFQYVVMVILVLALSSFYIGGVSHWDSTKLAQSLVRPENGPPFWVLFAIFFPAVTGFTQGVSMSGDLKDPGKSLPTGTFLAVGISIVVYLSVAVLFAAGAPLASLSGDYGVMGEISQWGILINAGVIAATLSSAMASFLGAPRILQSLAKDKIFPFLHPFAKGKGEAENPQRGVLLSGAIAVATIALGQLDLVARLVSMFFLISYGLLNYATYFEARAASPSFRPRFRWYHPHISLAGFVACLGVMLAIDMSSGIVAIAIIFAIYQYLLRTDRPSRWADSQRSHFLQRIRHDLLAAGSDPDHPRDWRPYILAFSDTPERRKSLLTFAGWLEGGSGITTVVRFLQGEGWQMRKLRQDALEEMTGTSQKCRTDVFFKVISGDDPHASLETLVQSFGVGPISANTVLMNWISDNGGNQQLRTVRYGKYLRSANRMGCHTIILCSQGTSLDNMLENDAEKLRIDVWWRGDATSRLMLLLAYLITRDKTWNKASIRVLAINYSEESEENLADFQEILVESRIYAEPLLVPAADMETVVSHSGDAALTFVPFSLKTDEPVDMFGNPLKDLVSELGMTALVQAGQDVELDAEPEDGEAGLLAGALDALERAERRTELAEKMAVEAAALAEARMNEVELAGGVLDDSALQKLKKALQAREKAEQAERKVVREKAKSEEAARELKAHGGPPDSSDE